MKKQLLILISLLTTVLGIAGLYQWRANAPEVLPDAAWLMQQIHDANKPGSSLQYLEGSMKMIDVNGSKDKIIEEKAFRWWYGQDQYAYFLDSVCLIQEKGKQLMVDHLNQQMVLQTLQLGNAGIPQVADVLSRIKELNAVISVRKEDGLLVLQVDSIQAPDVQAYSIYVDPERYRVRKMIMGMNRLMPTDDTEAVDAETKDDVLDHGLPVYTYLLEIEYHQAKHFAGDLFPGIAEYLSPEGNEFIPRPPYQYYRLDNLINQQAEANEVK